MSSTSAIDTSKKQGYKDGQSIYRHYMSVPLYQFLDDAYTGLGGFSGQTESYNGEVVYSYIHPKKTENSYLSRVKRSIYRNMYRPFIDAQYKPVFSDDPATVVTVGESVFENHPYQLWTDNVDGAGLSKNQFLSNAMKSGYKDGVSFLVMDKAEGDAEPYVYLQRAANVDKPMLKTNKRGQLEQIAFVVMDEDEKGEPLYTRTIWTNDSVTIQESKDRDKGEWKTISQSPLSVSKMPVYPLFTVDREDPTDYLPHPAESFNVARGSVGVYNQSCQRIWHSVMQSVALLVFIDFSIDQINEGYTNAAEGTSAPDKTPSAQFLSADAAIAANLKEDELDMIAGLIDLMAESGVVLTQSQYDVPESGAARLYRFRGQQTKLKYSRKIAVMADNWMQEMHKEYQGGGEWTATTLYPTDFSIQEPVSLADLRELFYLYKDSGYFENMKAVLVEIAKQVVGDNETVKELMQEIEQFNPTPEVVEA